MFLYLDSKLHKGRSNVVASPDVLRVSPVAKVKPVGKGQGIGTKGGVVVGVKGAGTQADDDEGMAYASDDPKNALNISVPSKPTVNIRIRSTIPKDEVKKSDLLFAYLENALRKAQGDQGGQVPAAPKEPVAAAAPAAAPAPPAAPAAPAAPPAAPLGVDNPTDPSLAGESGVARGPSEVTPATSTQQFMAESLSPQLAALKAKASNAFLW